MKLLESLRNRSLSKVKWRLEIFHNGYTRLEANPEDLKDLKRTHGWFSFFNRFAGIYHKGEDVRITFDSDLNQIISGDKENLIKAAKGFKLKINTSCLDSLIAITKKELKELQQLKDELNNSHTDGES